MNSQEYIFRVPLLVERIVKIFIILFTLFFWYFFIKNLNNKDPIFAKILLGLLAITWTLIITSENFRNPWIFFKANQFGLNIRLFKSTLHFNLKSSNEEYLFIPWEKIEKVEVTNDEEGSKSIALYVNISFQDWLKIYPSKNNSQQYFNSKLTNKEKFETKKIMFYNNLNDVHEVVASLNKMKKK